MEMSLELNDVAHKVLMETMPAISAIFELGFIPKENEIVKLDDATCDEAERQLGLKKKRPLYAVEVQDPENAVNGMSVMDEKEVGYLIQGIDFFAKYARKNRLPANDSVQKMKAEPSTTASWWGTAITNIPWASRLAM